MAKKDYRKDAVKRALKYVERVEASCPQLCPKWVATFPNWLLKANWIMYTAEMPPL